MKYGVENESKYVEKLKQEIDIDTSRYSKSHLRFNERDHDLSRYGKSHLRFNERDHDLSCPKNTLARCHRIRNTNR